MAITVNWSTGVIDSTASILDLPAFHAALRDLEDDDVGMFWPTTHTWRALDLGGGAYFYQLDLINGYTLRFPSAGNYTINGNLNATIVPVAGVYVERKTSAAYVTTAIGGGSGLTAEQDARLAALARIHGLIAGEPLVVTPTQRTAGGIVQTIAEAGGTVTVERTA